MFLRRNTRDNVYPCNPKFYYIKRGFKGVKIVQACFLDVLVPRLILFITPIMNLASFHGGVVSKRLLVHYLSRSNTSTASHANYVQWIASYCYDIKVHEKGYGKDESVETHISETLNA